MCNECVYHGNKCHGSNLHRIKPLTVAYYGDISLEFNLHLLCVGVKGTFLHRYVEYVEYHCRMV